MRRWRLGGRRRSPRHPQLAASSHAWKWFVGFGEGSNYIVSNSPVAMQRPAGSKSTVETSGRTLRIRVSDPTLATDLHAFLTSMPPEQPAPSVSPVSASRSPECRSTSVNARLRGCSRLLECGLVLGPVPRLLLRGVFASVS